MEISPLLRLLFVTHTTATRGSVRELGVTLIPAMSSRYKVTYKKDTGECKLEISMTFADDAGEYSVFAKNQLGEVSASASLLEEGVIER